MKDGIHLRPVAPSAIEGDEVTRLARRAIALLSADGPGRTDGMARRFAQMSDAFISPEGDAHHAALLRLRQDGIARDDIVDHVVPAVARMLGERWMSDEISFAHVTIGAARLQETVRSLGRRDGPDRPRDSRAPRVLLAIPRGEHHTLGTFVLADQMRRHGFAVDTLVDVHPRQLTGVLRRNRYSMVGITASGRRTLASVRELVDTVHRSVTRVTPTVIGGPVLETVPQACALTGADHAARDAVSALVKCRLLDVGGEALSEPRMKRAGHGGPAAGVGVE